MQGEERDYFKGKIESLYNTILTMPKSYEQDGKGDEAIAYLHYFTGGCGWHITEKDMEGLGTLQAFGLADIGYGGELGYISIQELSGIAQIELDLHFKPTKLLDIKQPKKTVNRGMS